MNDAASVSFGLAFAAGMISFLSPCALLQQIGGVIIAAFGFYLTGLLRLPWLMRERRVHLSSQEVRQGTAARSAR